MEPRTRFACVLIAVIMFNRVKTQSSQIVYAPVGHDVLLTCLCLEQPPFVYWEDINKNILLDMFYGWPDIRFQDEMFRGRVQNFPLLYKKENCSVLLKNVAMSDSNFYTCIIRGVVVQTLQLVVSDGYVSGPQMTPPGP